MGRTRYVYRVQNNYGKGPYAHGCPGIGFDAPSHRPAPEHDGLGERWNIQHSDRFAFSTMSKLFSWFETESVLRCLEEGNQYVWRIRVPRESIRFGKKQLIFNINALPPDHVDKEERMSWSEVHRLRKELGSPKFDKKGS